MDIDILDFDAQKMREKVLDLAMQGKLVSQNLNDEPASVLLEKIKAKKERLVKEKKIKKTKVLPAITDEEKPFDIPDSWEWMYLSDAASITKLAGFEYSKYIKPNLKDNGIPLFKAKNIQSGKIVHKFENYISEELSDSLIRSQLNRKCLLTPYVGSIGKVAVFSGKYKAHLGSNVGKIEMIKAQDEGVDESFAMYYLQSSYGFKQLTKHLKSTAQPSISITALREVIIPLPPLSEQKRIAAKIAQLFALLRKVESSTQQYAELQTLLKSRVLDLAMRGKLVKQDPNDEPASVLLEKIKTEKAELVKEKKIKKSKPLPPITDEEKPFDIPDSWEWVRLGDVAKKITDGTHNPPPNSHSGKQLISAINIKNGKIDFKLSNRFVTDSQFEKEDKRTHIRKGDVLLTIVGSLGNAAIVENDKIFTAQRSVAIISSDLLSKYLYYSLTSKMFQEQIFNNAKGTTQRGIYLKKLSGLILPLPPINEQCRIGNKINELYWLI